MKEDFEWAMKAIDAYAHSYGLFYEMRRVTDAGGVLVADNRRAAVLAAREKVAEVIQHLADGRTTP